jgi:hypothetical protein
VVAGFLCFGALCLVVYPRLTPPAPRADRAATVGPPWELPSGLRRALVPVVGAAATGAAAGAALIRRRAERAARGLAAFLRLPVLDHRA